MINEILGKKIGMTQLFDDSGAVIGVTLIEIRPVCILEKVSYPKGVKAKIGAFKVDKVRLNKVRKPISGYFSKLGLSPYRVIKEVNIENETELQINKEVGIDLFREGSYVDVQAKSKGKGFQGGMKRHGWRGQPRTHGSTSHRRIGSAGATTYPGRIIKGINMPGHMGNRFVTVKNIKIIKVDKDKNILFINGAIPGATGGVVLVRKVKK